MSASEEHTSLEEVTACFEWVHPGLMLAGYYDDAVEPTEYTIQSRDVANFTAWISADTGSVVSLREVR